VAQRTSRAGSGAKDGGQLVFIQTGDYFKQTFSASLFFDFNL